MLEIEMSAYGGEDPSLQNYLQSIGRYKQLTKEREIELARRIRAGDREALDQLVNANLACVLKIAKANFNCGLGLMDLIAEGTVGLISAARHYDYRGETRFISFAMWRVARAIQEALADQAKTAILRPYRPDVDREDSGRLQCGAGSSPPLGPDPRSTP